MFNVNNKKTIALLANSSFKANRLRNLFAVVAIILTSVLFTSLFTIVSSLIVCMEESTMRQVGESAHGGFKYLSNEEYEILKNHPSIKNISYSVPFAFAQNKELLKRPSEIRYTSGEENAKEMFCMPEVGRLPEKDNEIATDTLVLKRLGIDTKLGQEITLEYSIKEQKYTEKFKLVGFWQGDVLSPASTIWLNRSYVEQKLKGYIPEHENDPIGTINASLNFSNSFNIEKKLQKIILDSGFTLDEIAYGVNWAYIGNKGFTDIISIIAIFGIISIIIFCGYLMISNIFEISIANDIKYYGLIKTIGTTPKQIHKIIRKQALKLCIIGIPSGIFSGYLIGILTTPLILKTLNTNVIKIYVNWIVFVLSALFSIFTVLISIAKASKIASKISPVEAIRTTDRINTKQKFKNSGKINLFTLANANLSRNKKKTILITISLSLGLIILNGSFSFANSFDMDKYLSGMIDSDFAVGDVSNFNVYVHYYNQDTLNSEFFDKLSKQNNIKDVNNIYFAETNLETSKYFNFDKILKQLSEEYGKDSPQFNKATEAENSQTLPTHVYGLDNGIFDRLFLIKGEIDIQKLSTGKYIIASPIYKESNTPFCEIGDNIQIKGKNGEINTYEVLAIAQIPHHSSIKHSHPPLTPDFYLPTDVFLSDIEEKAPMLSTINMKNENIQDMEIFLNDYCNNIDPNMAYNSKKSLVKEYENTKYTYQAVGIIISLIVSFIGIMNFINTIITSIIARKREFAMLQSIGMTSKQVTIILILESSIYMLLTFVIVLTVGSAICYFLISSLVSNALYMKMYFTIIPSLLCLPLLLLIAITIPLIYQKNVYNNSIIERLRETE